MLNASMPGTRSAGCMLWPGPGALRPHRSERGVRSRAGTVGGRQAELDINGRLVRAHVAAATMFSATDLVESRLRQRLERLAHHEEAKHLRRRGAGEHE